MSIPYYTVEGSKDVTPPSVPSIYCPFRERPIVTTYRRPEKPVTVKGLDLPIGPSDSSWAPEKPKTVTRSRSSSTGGKWPLKKGIKMTPYHNKRWETTSYFFDVLQDAAIGSQPKWLSHRGCFCASCRATDRTIIVCEDDGPVTVLTSVIHHYGPGRGGPAAPRYNVDLKAREVSNARRKVEADAYNRLSQGFDALTEAMEGPSTIRMVSRMLNQVRRPLRGLRHLRNRYRQAKRDGTLTGKLVDDLSSSWLTYRYGIMPVAYSIQDALDVAQKAKHEYKTGRGFAEVELDEESDKGPDDQLYYYQKVKGSVVLRSTAKARFDSAEVRLANQININPLLTAWELIPYSLIVDWFINVGDVLSARAPSFSGRASQVASCVSIRRKYTIETFLHVPSIEARDSVTYFKPGWYCGDDFRYEYDPSRGGTSFDISETALGGDVLVETKEVDTYSRYLYSNRDIMPSFSIPTSWKRGVDAVAMALRKLR